ncbi:MAG: hypothetical protein HY906_05055 [Deltaproteobacteria bacterium]|nr:hypothetical protein [Deltaproteobacteria bacterium]
MPSRPTNAARATWRSLLLGAVSVVLAGGCGSKAGISDPMKLVPADSRVLVQINVARLRQTQFKDRLLQLRDRSEGLKKKWDHLVQKSGLDPLRDIDTLLLAMPYQGEQGSGEAAVVALGRFNQPAIVAWFKEAAGAKFQETKHGNRTIYSNSAGQNLSFVSSTTAVVGDLTQVKRILDLADGKGQSARQSPKLVELTNRVQGNQTVRGVVSVPDEVSKRAKEADSPFKAVSAIVATIDFAAGLEFDFRAECSDENEAKSLTDKFNNLVKELLESPMLGSLGLGGIISELKGAQELKVFRVRGNLPQQKLDELIKKIEEAFKAKLGDLPRIKLPSVEEGGPKIDDSQPAPDKTAPDVTTDDKASEGKGDEPKAAPGEGSDGMPSLKLNLPGGTKGKRRPSLLGQ